MLLVLSVYIYFGLIYIGVTAFYAG